MLLEKPSLAVRFQTLLLPNRFSVETYTDSVPIISLIRNEGFAQTEGKAPPWQPNSPFNRLLDLLHQWHSHLPPFLEFNDMNMYVQKELSNLSSFFTLHLMYHSCIFDLTRVTLAGYSFPLAAAMASAPIDAKKRYQLMAWEHAVEVSDLLNKSFECGSGALDDYFVPTAAFESTKIQVIYSTTVANGDADIYARTASNINTNLHVLTATHPFVDMPNIYVSAMTILVCNSANIKALCVVSLLGTIWIRKPRVSMGTLPKYGPPRSWSRIFE